jgi:hypothetical protein
MNLFRSGEQLPEQGETIPVMTLALLSAFWWGDRLAADWRPHTREQNQAILELCGLTGDFWQLPS